MRFLTSHVTLVWFGKGVLHLISDDIFFWPTSRKVLTSFQTFCPVGVQIAQMVVHFTLFKVQARKRGVLGWICGCLVYVYIPERGVR